ncbi:AAA family ATPase [Aeromicrobium sp.]|uniref:AAA family ATPase n=1 Tax=Aeromicrobium sp. TaxID=1871063 RepID=UPI002FC9FB93
MSVPVVIVAPDQTTGMELRSQVDEVDDFIVVDVVDTTTRLHDTILDRQPDIVLIHESVGPLPTPQAVRDMQARHPDIAAIVLTDRFSPEVFTAAMDAGARGVLQYPTSHDDLQQRLPAAAEWVRQMRRHLSSGGGDDELGARGRMIAVAGSKGGVGTTTIAVHLGHDAVTRVPGRSVCVVDLDLDGGDVGDFLGIEHRLDISDLAKVADDLSAQTVESAVHRSPSGLAAVLAPSRVEDIGEVSERETLLLLAALRRHFDLVIADCGSSINPATAAAVETADDVILVTTPDLLALRGAHRAVESWRRIGARELDAVKILVNRASRDSDIQHDTASRLLPKDPLGTVLPESMKVLQRGLNLQNPSEIRSPTWWSLIQGLAGTLNTVPDGKAASTKQPTRSSLRRRKTRSAKSTEAAEPVNEAGQSTIEFIGALVPIGLFILLLWQVGLWGVTAAYTSHAANTAGREASLGRSAAEVSAEAKESVAPWFRDLIDVDLETNTVVVRGHLPILVPGMATGVTISSSAPILDESE